MRNLNVLTLLLMLIYFTLSPIMAFGQRAGPAGTGGGGGLERNGNIVTFGTAQVEVKQKPLSEIPGLSFLVTSLQKIPMGADRKRLLSAVLPVGARKYYSINPRDLTPEMEKELINQYKKTFKDQIKEDETIIFALTKGTETFLLPKFWNLSSEKVPAEIQQAAILYHESLWVIDPSLSYDTVLDSEIKFQDYLLKSKGVYRFDSTFYATLNEIFWTKDVKEYWDKDGSNTYLLRFKNSTQALQAAFQEDKKEGRLSQFLTKNGHFRVSSLLGNQPTIKQNDGREFSRVNEFEYDSDSVVLHLYQMIEKYPRVVTFRAMLDLANSKRNPFKITFPDMANREELLAEMELMEHNFYKPHQEAGINLEKYNFDTYNDGFEITVEDPLLKTIFGEPVYRHARFLKPMPDSL